MGSFVCSKCKARNNSAAKECWQCYTPFTPAPTKKRRNVEEGGPRFYRDGKFSENPSMADALIRAMASEKRKAS